MKKRLEYPLKIFKNKFVLKTVIHSIWINFILLSIAFEIDSYDSYLFERYKGLYHVLKAIFNTYLSVCIMAYYISKNKVCLFTLISFYSIVLMRLTTLALIVISVDERTPYIVWINRVSWILIIYSFFKNKINKIVVSPN